MIYVTDSTGRIVNQSRNLAGVRRYVRRHLIDRVSIAELPSGRGDLTIAFANGCRFRTTFESYSVLREWLARWRHVWGSPLSINGQDAGFISSRNP